MTTTAQETVTLHQYIDSLPRDYQAESDTFIAITSMNAMSDEGPIQFETGTILYSPRSWLGDAALHKDFTNARPAPRRTSVAGEWARLVRCQPQDLQRGDLCVVRYGGNSRYTFVFQEHIDGMPLRLRTTLVEGGVVSSDTCDMSLSAPQIEEGRQQVWRVPLLSHSVTGNEPSPEPTVAEAELENDLRDARIAELEAQVEEQRQRIGRMEADRTELLRQWQYQNERLGNVFMEAANDNDLCSVYDNTVDTVNEFLQFPLPLREREYNVDFTISGTTTLTIRDQGVEVEINADWTAPWTQTIAAAGDPDGIDFADYIDYDMGALTIDVSDVNPGEVESWTDLEMAVSEAVSRDDVHDIGVDEVELA